MRDAFWERTKIMDMHPSVETTSVKAVPSKSNPEASVSEDDKSPNVSPSKKNKIPGRHVNFPEDDIVVTRKIDPPNPWKNAKEISTEELQAAYQAACYTMKLKPNLKVILQLQNIKDFSKRTECFSIKGEKVDIRVIETLEEVFKRVQFNTVDVEAASLDDETVAALFDMLEFYESAVRLVLASNRSIGARGWQAASRLLKRVSTLECLDIRNTNWTEYSMQMLTRSMRADITLSALHMEGCNLSGRCLFLLLMALKQNRSIGDLYLAENRLGTSDAIHLGSMLKHNKGLKLLDLRNNRVQDSGLSHLCDGLLDQLEGQLTTLVLWNNQLTQNGMTHLAKALPMLTSLQTLNLGQNNLSNDGVHILKDALMKNRSLLRLGLYACRFGDQGTVALAEYIADNWQLIRLDLRENDVRTGGLMALSYAMKVNKVLLRLDLDKEVKQEQMRGYEDLQRSLQNEIAGHIQRNRELSHSGIQPNPDESETSVPNLSNQDLAITNRQQQTNVTLELATARSDPGPQSPTTRLNPRTLNVKYVADPSDLPMETEASTVHNDPLNLVSCGSDTLLSEMSSTSDCSTQIKHPSSLWDKSCEPDDRCEPDHRWAQDNRWVGNGKDELDSPTGIPLANNIQLLTHPLHTAMAAASPLMLSTAVMKEEALLSATDVTSTVSTRSTTDSTDDDELFPEDVDRPSDDAAQSQVTTSDVTPVLTGPDRDPLMGSIIEGSGDKNSTRLSNGTLESGNQVETAGETDSRKNVISSSPDTFEKELDQIMAKVKFNMQMDKIS